ncbi:Ig-like domain-containing protein [Treponema parvum]|uniref:Ig-like domain-containing protein n=1 Tax=Treponema parvum TaxID=138851 RepID=A0A975F648_9SPIR|nr:Ig-like domain-containing protein [Treponema parvum]QTQ14993.1 Ig-like domain-containing protein [Treponema parvum]
MRNSKTPNLKRFISFIPGIFSLLLPILILPAISGCADRLLPELKVESVTYDLQKVSVSFSERPDESSFQRGFSITEDKASLNGTYVFSGTTVHFFPVNGIRQNYDYRVILSTQIEDIEGRSLMHDFSYFFSTRSSSEIPFIVSQFPAKEAEITGTLSELTFTFSVPINTQTFHSAFSVSPAFNYLIDFSDNDTKAHVIPTQSLEKQKRYTLTVSTSLEDKNRNSPREDYVSIFYYDLDRTEAVLSVQSVSEGGAAIEFTENSSTNDVPLNSKIQLNFTKPVRTDSVSGFISIDPPLSYSIRINKETRQKVTLVPSDAEWGKTYTLHVKKGISDYYGNKIPSDHNFSFTYDNENNRPVLFESAFFQSSSSAYKTLSKQTEYSFLPLDPVFYPKNTETNGTLYLVFRISANAQNVNLFTVMDGFTISTVNGCFSIVLKNASLVPQSDFSSLPIATQIQAVGSTPGKLSIVKYTMEITNKDSSGIVSLNLSSTIQDNLGNPAKEGISLSFNK